MAKEVAPYTLFGYPVVVTDQIKNSDFIIGPPLGSLLKPNLTDEQVRELAKKYVRVTARPGGKIECGM